ncbi:hypothetical protein TCDM_07828 [Trypanosoma cruzi Dm28c]|uniref:Topoisomerase I C-terminal domain-containing protein n=1 Tax=Trypanosoma cruzi Dm28c TaxID=1416333 RepID=V5D9S6_TRYCR|nr:hypothetical protein TCDM_07828 [Trypanosoma cruzi Dm28c]
MKKKERGEMTEVTPLKAPLVTGAPTPPASYPPTKVPVKMPYVLPKPPFAPVVPMRPPAPRLKRDGDDGHLAVPGLADASKRSRVEDPERRGRAMSESSNSESSSNSDSDDDSDSDSHSSSSGSSGDGESFSSSTEGSGSDETRSGDELTLFEIAKARGLVNECVDNKKEEEEEEEVAPVGPPPRPPIVRSFPSNVDLALQRYEERLNREENMIRIKDDNKAVSLGTSKVNYIDPRIVCSWAKEYNVPIGKIFSATLQKKFPWAMGAENFSF